MGIALLCQQKLPFHYVINTRPTSSELTCAVQLRAGGGSAASREAHRYLYLTSLMDACFVLHKMQFSYTPISLRSCQLLHIQLITTYTSAMRQLAVEWFLVPDYGVVDTYIGCRELTISMPFNCRYLILGS